MGSSQASPSVREAAGTTVGNPEHFLSGSMCCSCFGGWGEPWPTGSVMLLSNSLCAQDKSISTWYCQTQTGSDAASTARAFLVTEQKFWEFSVFWGKGLVLSRLRLVIPATLWLLVFFYFLSQIGILLTNPNLVSWVTLYLLNFKVGLALEKKKKAFPH